MDENYFVFIVDFVGDHPIPVRAGINVFNSRAVFTIPVVAGSGIQSKLIQDRLNHRLVCGTRQVLPLAAGVGEQLDPIQRRLPLYSIRNQMSSTIFQLE
jgi:hypothetical protein